MTAYADGVAQAPGQHGGQGLPACFEGRADGIYIDPAALGAGDLLPKAADQLFNGGYVLRGLDYPLFQRLLYEPQSFKGHGPQRIAKSIELFPAERRAYYRDVRVIDGNAEYLFEPIEIEKEVDGHLVSERLELDIDEFVAIMWTKGVRFGIVVDQVVAAMHSSAPQTLMIAYELVPMPGKDGGVEEQTPDLHRSNAPRVLPDGRADLSQFANRFPQVQEGQALLKKSPALQGTPGRKIDGQMLLPPPCKDFDLAALVGEGTRLERRGDSELIVAAIKGFLSVDTATNQLSVNEKIINRDGVSARTTGNLALKGDEYEEYGEVQEGRIVEGKNLTFHADVCGRVMSTGGRIVLEKNLIGGVALNRDGSIQVKGRASGAHLQVARGTVRIEHAENCVVAGDRVEIKHAAGCTVLADEVVIQTAEGCAVAGRRIEIASATDRAGEDTLVSMLMPDLVTIDAKLSEEKAYLAECETLVGKMKKGLEVITSQPDFQQFIATAGKLQRKELTLTEKQEEQWFQFKARMASTLKRASEARADIKALEDEMAGVKEAIATLQQRRRDAGVGLRCLIGSVAGETVVRTYILAVDAPPLTRLQPKELNAALRGPAPGEQRLFAGDSGDFAWKSA